MFNILKIILLSIFTKQILGGNIIKCNECVEPVEIQVGSYDVKYVLCSFDTTLSVHKNNSLTEPIKWLFIGTRCDDRCDTPEVAEGYLCSAENEGYYEVVDGIISEKVENKIEFHHFACNITDTEITLHTHRFMPNYALKNVSIPYYVESGDVGLYKVGSENKFLIQY